MCAWCGLGADISNQSQDNYVVYLPEDLTPVSLLFRGVGVLQG